MKRFYSERFKEKLISVLREEEFDIVQLEGLPMCNYIDTVRKYSKAKISYRAHNVEHVVWDRIAFTEASWMRKVIYRKLAHRLKKYEYSILNEADFLVPISSEDEKKFLHAGNRVPVHTAVVGVDTSLYSMVQKDGEFPSLFHFGSMDWLPNEEAVKWFLKEIWPKIKVRFPDLCFYIAGRNFPDWLHGISDKNIKLVENTPDAKEFIRSKSILVVPLRSGSGMKVKIIEGLASGKAIVTTPTGAEGIDAENGKNILIADTADEFCDAVTRLVMNKEFFNSICREARVLAEMKFDSFRVAADLSGFYKKMIDTGS